MGKDIELERDVGYLVGHICIGRRYNTAIVIECQFEEQPISKSRLE